MKILNLILISLIIISCGETTGDKENTLKNNAEKLTSQKRIKKMGKKLEGEELITYLSNKLRPEQKTQADIDHNLIVNYAIDKELYLQESPRGLFYSFSDYGDEETYPTRKSRLKAHYIGKMLNGKKFDSSYDRGKPLVFRTGQVIIGWQEALLMMSKGSKATFYIPSRFAYGPEGSGNIPPNSVLVFDIELLDIK